VSGEAIKNQTTMKTPTMKKPRTARGAATRQKLLDAAEALFGTRGFHATSVTDITRTSGVSQGTFYLYFESKEEIFRELVRDLSHRLRAAIQQQVEGIASRVEVEEVGLRTFLEFAAAHRNLYRIVFESQFIDPALFRWYYERIATGYSRGLRQAMRSGEVREQHPETLAYCLMGAAHFLGMRWVVWEGVEPPAEVMETLRQFIRSALVPEAAASGAASRAATARGSSKA
jgi:AcrR family transcriptional regulator